MSDNTTNESGIITLLCNGQYCTLQILYDNDYFTMDHLLNLYFDMCNDDENDNITGGNYIELSFIILMSNWFIETLTINKNNLNKLLFFLVKKHEFNINNKERENEEREELIYKLIELGSEVSYCVKYIIKFPDEIFFDHITDDLIDHELKRDSFMMTNNKSIIQYIHIDKYNDDISEKYIWSYIINSINYENKYIFKFYFDKLNKYSDQIKILTLSISFNNYIKKIYNCFTTLDKTLDKTSSIMFLVISLKSMNLCQIQIQLHNKVKNMNHDDIVNVINTCKVVQLFDDEIIKLHKKYIYDPLQIIPIIENYYQQINDIIDDIIP